MDEWTGSKTSPAVRVHSVHKNVSICVHDVHCVHHALSIKPKKQLTFSIDRQSESFFVHGKQFEFIQHGKRGNFTKRKILGE